mmetsp:Transcript_21749/g.32495  ORF Transcript_21749/g.32495 Transcript_21749/m.32495 type:complete len:278 (-) Transcript_21749:2727-3560(-)
MGAEPPLGLAGRSGAGTSLVSPVSPQAVRYILIFSAFVCSTFVIMPYSLYLAFENWLDLNANPMYLILLAMVVIALLFVWLGRTLYENNVIRRKRRRWFAHNNAVLDSTYGCISPQGVLGSVVIFPVQISKRDAKRDVIFKLEATFLNVHLEQGESIRQLKIEGVPKGEKALQRRLEFMKIREADTERRVRALVVNAVARNNVGAPFQVKILSGANSGPTGLSVLILCPDYGPTLAAFVGKCFEEMAVHSITPPPIYSFTSKVLQELLPPQEGTKYD